MARQRRILGMTTVQITILIGLGAAACVLFAITGWLALRGGFQAAPVRPLSPQVTATPFVLPTVTPTGSPTPVAYEQLIPQGWVQHKTTLMEIWLPSNFNQTTQDADEELRLSGLYAPTSLYKMMVIIGYQPLGPDTVDSYIDNQLLKIDPTVRAVERRKVSLNGTAAVRMVLEARVNSVDMNELAYLIQDGGTLWVVYYLAQINEFYEVLPMFEQSAKTFRIVQ